MKRLQAILFTFFLCAFYLSAQVFPKNNFWNTPVDALPVHPQSSAWITLIGSSAKLRLDDGIPVNLVTSTTPLVSVGGLASPDSDGGGYPIPSGVLIESGSDAHCILWDKGRGLLYEIFALAGGPGAWTGYSASKWDLNSNALRTSGYTSADAAGLPILPGLLQYDEVAAGAVNHSLRFTAPYSQGLGVFLWPARHYASHNPDGPPMGARVRLKAGFDMSGFSPAVQVILKGLQKYGATLADNGMPWGMQFASDPRWNLADLATIHNILGSSMEVVDTSSLMTDPDSGAAGTPVPGVFVTDLLGRKNSVPLGAGLAIVNGALTATGSVVASAPGATSIWKASVPANPWQPDPAPVTLGVKFRSDVAGTVVGIRFYKGTGNNKPHIGLLYSAAGTLLAQAAFSDESVAGWEQVDFLQPVPILANTTYIAAYFTSSGYADDQNYFGPLGVDNAPLHALKSGVDGLNGVYSYGVAPRFPNQTWNNSNYWVDVVFAAK